jgi:hypothetical protein
VNPRTAAPENWSLLTNIADNDSSFIGTDFNGVDGFPIRAERAGNADRTDSTDDDGKVAVLWAILR